MCDEVQTKRRGRPAQPPGSRPSRLHAPAHRLREDPDMATNTGKISYSPELGEAICDFIMDGGSVRAFCAQPGTPSWRAVFLWLNRYPEFATRYTAARLMQAETLADEMIDLADGDGDPRLVRLQLQARMWLAERLAPKKYGPRRLVEHSGKVSMTVEVVRFAEKQDAAGSLATT